MKKILCIFLIAFICLGLTGCYVDLEENSLEDYILFINQHNQGKSSVEIDDPRYLLPGISFFEEYEYLEGGYFWREDDPLRGLFTSNVFPNISLLYLRYDENVYPNAKQAMFEKIEPYGDKFYEYNNYVFYENSNFISLNGARFFPEELAMACYNDSNNTLLFIGLYSGTLAGPSCLDDKYLEDIDNNWEDFIDQYYGEYYDFSN